MSVRKCLLVAISLLLVSSYVWAQNVLPDWGFRFGDSESQLARALAVDANGNIIVTGNFAGTVDFGGTPVHRFPSTALLMVQREELE
jgi:hypothetical protein